MKNQLKLKYVIKKVCVLSVIKGKNKMKYPQDFINKIICGDCLEVMKEMPDGSVDLILTDPPYNAPDIGPQHKKYSHGKMQLPLKEYKAFCQDWIKKAKRLSNRIVFTPGIANMCFYPQPSWCICWHKPAAVSFNRMGGYNAWEPIFIYGKIARGQRLGQDYILFNTLNLKKGIESNYPCPKPQGLWNILMDKFSLPGDLVLDPFIGSGTSARAAKDLKRNFIGIDTNPEYCKIAEERLSQGVL